MKPALMAGVAAFAFTGLAQASAFQAGDNIISVTLTGFISGGTDTGPTGTNDDFNAFGGGDLLNAPVTVNFSYDATFISASAGLQTSYQDTQTSFRDNSDPDGYQIGVRSGSDSYSVTPSLADLVGLCDTSFCGDNESTTLGQDLSFNFIDLDASNTDGSNLPIDFTIQSEVSAMFTNPDNSFVLVVGSGVSGGPGIDTLDITATPEPATWLSLTTGLVGLRLLRLLRLRRSPIAR